jgi:predicted enzyme related to lactoylglutathione lyase
VRVEQQGGSVIGTATSIDDMGQLVLTVDGEEIAFAVGDVVHVRAHDGSTT